MNLLGNKGEEMNPEDFNRRLIDNIGLSEPLVHAIMMLHRRGDINYEQALIFMVKELSDMKTTYFNEVVHLRNQSTEPLKLSRT